MGVAGWILGIFSWLLSYIAQNIITQKPLPMKNLHDLSQIVGALLLTDKQTTKTLSHI